ncbi:hypothetical protein MKZ40_15760 [Cobetia sp. BMC6]|nr:hypothetical protein [Cobetia marina]MDI4662469.1 hypothetical protein [Cobetia sp. BMC6]
MQNSSLTEPVAASAAGAEAMTADPAAARGRALILAAVHDDDVTVCAYKN